MLSARTPACADLHPRRRQQPTRGQLYANGARSRSPACASARPRISAVFEFSPVPQLTVAENLFLGAEPTRHGILTAAPRSTAPRVLERWIAARGKQVHSSAPSSRWWR
jgi:ABC-type sugar transport system ATPase subunit